MIIRELKENTNLINTFDFFNDYKDTRYWAKYNAPELLPILDNEYKKWIEEYERNLKCLS